jgi:hypothetical protein
MKYGMATTVTLVFSDETHRGAWLRKHVLNSGEFPDAMKSDYNHRHQSQNLIYTVGAFAGDEFLDDVKESLFDEFCNEKPEKPDAYDEMFEEVVEFDSFHTHFHTASMAKTENGVRHHLRKAFTAAKSSPELLPQYTDLVKTLLKRLKVTRFVYHTITIDEFMGND